MRRLFCFILLAAGLHVLVIPLAAQYAPVDYLEPRDNGGSVGVRMMGRTKVTFSNVGTVTTARSAGDLTSEIHRSYDNGHVFIDARTDGEGNRLADDGRTNTWGYHHEGQVTPDEMGISLSIFSSTSEGASLFTESGANIGVDIDLSRRLGEFGRSDPETRAAFTWGTLFGFGLTDVNARKRDQIRATLHSLTDTYSLLGSPPPPFGETGTYSAPSFITETVTNPDGTTTDFVVDTTTLLANRPESRSETSVAGAALIDGFWQIKGAYFTLRTGPWVRWHPAERLSVRFSAGPTWSMLGLTMRHDERLVIDDLIGRIENRGETDTQTHGVFGAFAGMDVEWWLTERTGFFGSAYYEGFSRNAELTAGDRLAQVQVSGGVGLRFGLTTRF